MYTEPNLSLLKSYWQTILMIFERLNWFCGILFFVACFAALMNPPPYVVIGTLFFLMGLVLLPATSRLTKQQFNWQINGGTKTTVILIGFILIYFFVPQVEIQPSPFTTRPVTAEIKRL